MIYDTIKAAVRVHGLLVIANVSIQLLSLIIQLQCEMDFDLFFLLNNELSSGFY